MSKPKRGIPPSKRGRETEESKTFRQAMAEPRSEELDLTVKFKAIMYWIEQGVLVKDFDVEKLIKLCALATPVVLDEELIPMVKPLVDVDHYQQFDSAACAAGLKKFVRPAHTTDKPIVAPLILVAELSPGIRHRTGAMEEQKSE